MILAGRGGNLAVQTRAANALSDLASARSYAGGQVAVTTSTALGVPAIDAAISFAAAAVASMTLGVWRGDLPNRQRVTSTWQARLFRDAPNPEQDRFTFWETVEASLTARGNAYIWRTVGTDGRVKALWALHPDQVSVTASGGRPVFRVTISPDYVDPTGLGGPGWGYVEVGPDTVLHMKGPGGGGMLVAPSPIDRHRVTIGAALAAQSYQEGFYTRGTGGGFILSFPQDLPPRAVRDAKEVWDASNAGVQNAHGTRVIAGGATAIPVTISQRDAQWVEGAQLTVQDVARIFRVPSSLIEGAMGIGAGGGPISPEHEQTRWARYGLTPRLLRIEAALEADPWLFGPGAKDRPMFDRLRIVQGDVLTEAEADVKLVQAGIDLVDDVRARRGLPPLPDGVGQIPQITPVGGAPNPNSPPPPAAPEPDADDQED